MNKNKAYREEEYTKPGLWCYNIPDKVIVIGNFPEEDSIFKQLYESFRNKIHTVESRHTSP
jgi:hypothetical protein